MASTPRLQVGTIFAQDYRIVGPLAEGGMGSVYRAEQLSTHKPRAVKVVHGRLLDDERSRMRFVREATVAASIASEHVVEVIAAGIDAATELPYLVMELLDGGDLAAVVRHRGRLTVPELGGLLRQLCHGLGAAHAARVIHRDLKPENIFVAHPRHAGTRFTVKILDFGIAKVTQESKTAATLTGTVGSPLWMAPEQINNEALGPQTDIWALGLLAFWALTGQSYWRTARAERLTIQALFAEQLFRPLEPASVRAAEFGMAAEIPTAFDDWFMHCVTRSPADRFGEAGAAWAAFEQSVDAGLLADVTLLPPIGEVWESTSSPIGVVDSTIAEGGGDGSSASVASFATTFGGVMTVANTGTELPTPPPHAMSGASREFAAAPQREHAWLRPAVLWPLAGTATMTLAAAVVAWVVVSRPTDDHPQHDAREPLAPVIDSGRPETPPSEPTIEPTSQTPSKTPSEPTIEPTSKPPIGPTNPLEATSATAGAFEQAAIAVIRPMTTQPSFSAGGLKFLGWSTDRSRFALEATYPNRDGAAVLNHLRLVEVHDALTGLMVNSFVVERDADATVSERDRLARAAAEAEPYVEWPEVRDQLGLTATDASQMPPEGLARLELTMSPATAQDEVVTEATAEGFAFRWTVGPTAPDARTTAPRLALHWTSGAQRWELLEVPLSINADELLALRTAATKSVYAGTIALHWAPQARRVLVLIRERVEPVEVAPPSSDSTPVVVLADNRWFLRAGGAQIRLVDGGAGQRKLRHAAWQLEQAGIPIAAADLDHESVESSRTYVRARDPAAAVLAQDISTALDVTLPSALLDRAGWTQIVLMLGPDFDGRPE